MVPPSPPTRRPRPRLRRDDAAFWGRRGLALLLVVLRAAPQRPSARKKLLCTCLPGTCPAWPRPSAKTPARQHLECLLFNDAIRSRSHQAIKERRGLEY